MYPNHENPFSIRQHKCDTLLQFLVIPFELYQKGETRDKRGETGVWNHVQVRDTCNMTERENNSSIPIVAKRAVDKKKKELRCESNPVVSSRNLMGLSTILSGKSRSRIRKFEILSYSGNCF